MSDKKKFTFKLITALLVSFVVSCILLRVYSGNLSITGMNFCRFEIIFIVIAFLSIHFVFEISIIYDVLFRYRWVFGFILLLFIVMNKFNGSSIGMYNTCIQPGMGSEYTEAVLGEPRGIRSDEWVVSTPGRLSAFQLDNPYGKYNSLMRGTDTLNDLSINFKMLGNNIFKYCFVLLGKEYGFSCFWFMPIILAFLINFELFYILTKKDRLISLTGTTLVVFSAFYMWWTFPTQLLYMPAALVCFYYFINSEKLIKKTLFAIGLVFAFTGFVVNVYPAWQVPMGYTAVLIALCIIHELWDKVKKLSRKTWIIFGVAAVVALLMIFGYITDYLSEYSAEIASTVYPGLRRSAGGPDGSFNAIQKLFYSFQQTLYPFKDTNSNSEGSAFLCFFPIPFIMLAYQWLKDKKKDWLKTGLIIIGVFFTVYIILGVPMFLSQITLMSYSYSTRVADILGYICIISLTVAVARKNEYKCFHPAVGVVLALLYCAGCIYACQKWYPGFMPIIYIILMAIITAFLVYCITVKVNDKLKNIACVIIIVISAVTALPVNPVMRGLDVIYSKPVAKEIMNITEENDDKWMTCGGGIVFSSYALLCGAPTINYTNIYPNLELWNKLDEDKQFNEIYNRYAHVGVELTSDKTSFELIGADYMQLKLSYSDISKTGVKYIFSDHKLDENNGYVEFKQLYNEAGCYIYNVSYN